MTKNILITGAGGMVGKNLLDSLIAFEGYKVFPTYYDITIPKKDCESVNKIINEDIFLNILDKEALEDNLKKIKPDIIIHLAAQSRPDISITRPIDTIQTNLFGTINLAESPWVKGNKPWIINFSSSAVYGDIDWINPATEYSPTKPITAYGVSKLSAERYLHANYEGICTSLRLFNCSGPYKTSDLISDISKRLSDEGERSLKIGNLDSKRHFLHVSDVVEVVKKLLLIEEEKRKELNREFNLAPTHKYLHTVTDVIYEFENILGHKINLIKDKNLYRSKDEKVIWGNSNLLSKILNWKSKQKLKDIIKDSLIYTKKISKH